MKKIGLYLIGGLLMVGLLTLVITKLSPKKKSTVAVVPNIPQIMANGIPLSTLINNGADAVCTFIQNSQTLKQKGTIYMSTGKVRVDNEFEGKTGSHLINDNGWYYVWTDNLKGLKVDTSQFPQMGASNSGDRLLQAYANMNSNTPVTCIPKTFDKNVFILPKNVEFTDLTQQMKALKQ